MTSTWTTRASVFAIGALLLSTAALAQSSRQVVQLSLDDAVERAIERNPDLAIVRLYT